MIISLGPVPELTKVSTPTILKKMTYYPSTTDDYIIISSASLVSK
jgi:hypothetical protein